ncbi:MAG: hypothetical protein J6K25_10745 [Thermoguttaceae bacterium]|nr:hypothetical protein [Thermoguttaceae bacterium]
MVTYIAPIAVKNPLGNQSRAYVGKTTGSLESLTKIPCVRSVSVQFTSDQVDLSTRDDGGWKRPVPGEKSATVELEFLVILGDPIQEAFFEAYYADEPSTIAATFIPAEDVKAMGYSGDWIVTDVGEDQPRNEGVPWKISLASYGKIERFKATTTAAANVEPNEDN